MPCYTVALQSVAIEVPDPTVLQGAVDSLPGWVILNQSERLTSIRTASGANIEIYHELKQAELQRRDASQIDALKRAYSTQIIKTVQKKFGWALKKTTENGYKLQKRGF